MRFTVRSGKHPKEETFTHRHQIGRVTSYGVELKPRFPHKIGKSVMCCQTDTVASSLQTCTVCDKWLHITFCFTVRTLVSLSGLWGG
jgi:hypothetical protein